MIYLLVIKLLEINFSLVISGLHSLPQPLQYLQKKGVHISKQQKQRGNIIFSCNLRNKNLQREYYLFFASAQLSLDFFSKVTRAAFWTSAVCHFFLSLSVFIPEIKGREKK